MSLNFILRVLCLRVQVIHPRVRVCILVESPIGPSLPEDSLQVQIPKTLILYQESILLLPTRITSHVMAQLETHQQLQCFQGGIFQRGVTGDESMGHFGPFRPLPSRIHHRVIVIGETGAEIYHGSLDQFLQGQFLWVCLVQQVEGDLVDEEMTYDLVSTRIALVNQVRSLVLPLLLVCNKLLQDRREVTVPQTKDRMLILGVIVKFVGTTDHLLLAVLSMPKEQTIRSRTVLRLDHKSSRHKSLQSPLGRGCKILSVLCPISLLCWLEGILGSSAIGSTIDSLTRIHTKEALSISTTAHIRIHREWLTLFQEFLTQFFPLPRTSIGIMTQFSLYSVIAHGDVGSQQHSLQ